MKTFTLGKALLTVALCTQTTLAQEPVWDGNKVELLSEQLADGVYAYYSTDAKALESTGQPVATSGGFVVGDRGVLIIDTMLNERLNTQVKQLVSKVTDKPITYAVNTSYHGDHSYGNMYLPENTIVIQHSHAKDYINEHFEADTQFMLQNFGAGRGIEEIVPRTGDVLIPEGGSLSVDLGNKIIQIMDFGFAQTGGDLFIWEPESKVMWAGNPIITVKPALPWLLDGHLLETLSTLQKVYAFLPDDARIVPGHGSVMQREDIKWHIDYLQAVKTQVQAALEDGLTLEETIAQVKMEEFAGYVLFGWVHPGLNIPAAYKDLAK